MAEYKFGLDTFKNPPEKVLRMFQAVIELVNEHVDVTGLKVQDITTRAGIGKGTAYEYFSSKEELITLAILYDYGCKLTELKTLMDQQADFRRKMYCVLDWLHDNDGYHRTFVRIIQISTEGNNPCETLENCITKDLFDGMHTYLMESGDAIMELGYREGVFTETDVVKRRMAFVTMITQLLLTLGAKTNTSFFVMEYEKMREYAYETMIKILS